MEREEENGRVEEKDESEKRNSRLRSLLATDERDYLLSQTGQQVKVSDLEGGIVALYFSANWYQQCVTFTQLLIPIYNHIKSHLDPNFEIVFVSCDEDSDAFDAYRSQMPWLAVPFSDLQTKRSLNKMFDVEGMPCLVILHHAGETSKDGVEIVFRHGAEAYPFSRERIEELERIERRRHEIQTLLSLLTNHERDYLLAHSVPRQVPVSSLVRKTVGLYFSAEWCIPCTKFTPKLISVYQTIKQTLAVQNSHDNSLHNDFEIVFVSCDRDERSFLSYFNSMPFPALPHGDTSIKALLKHFDVRDIPCLIVLGPDGKTVTKQGRNLINFYQEKAYPFTSEKVQLLERERDEEARLLPRTVRHVGHTRHELSLVSEGTGGGPFICCECDEQGSGWAYLCLDCGYEVHTHCIRTV